MSLFKSLAGTFIGRKVGKNTAGRGLIGAGIGFLVTRVATRSLPGAALVGGGYLAKKMYDKRKAERATETSQSTGLSDQDTDMAMARAAGETEIAQGVSGEAEQLDPIPPRPVSG